MSQLKSQVAELSSGELRHSFTTVFAVEKCFNYKFEQLYSVVEYLNTSPRR